MLIPKNILDLKPVIAGGFVTSLFYNILRYGDESKEAQTFMNSIFKESLVGKQHGNYKSTIKSVLGFGDIDFWFLNDADIRNEQHKYNLLIGDLCSSEDERKNVVGRFIDAPKISNDKIDLLQQLGLTVEKTSRWANSFRYIPQDLTSSGTDLKMQFISAQFDSIEGIFEKFDIINCCSAYYDGEFYIHDRLKGLADNNLIAFNPLNSKYIISNMISAIRSFKYAQRHAAFFSEDASKKVFDIFIDTSILHQELAVSRKDAIIASQASQKAGPLSPIQIGSTAYGNGNVAPYNPYKYASPAEELKVKLSSLSSTFDPYGIGNELSYEFVERTINQLYAKFDIFMNMPSFKESYIPYFINIKELEPVIRPIMEGKRKIGKNNFDSLQKELNIDIDIDLPF